MRSTTATQPGSPRRPRRCCTLGTEFVHDRDGEFTLIDARLSGHGDTLEPDFSVFYRRLCNPSLHTRQA
jgi:hypothetical protein